jgi:hypothetical protein
MLRKNLIALVLLDAINKEEAKSCPHCDAYLDTPDSANWQSYFNLENLGAGGWTTTVST